MTAIAATSYTLRDIVAKFGGEIEGNPDVRVTRVATLENAGPDSITFLANSRYLRLLATTQAAAVILAESQRRHATGARIVSDNPYAYFARVSALFNPPRAPVPGRHASAILHSAASIAAEVEIGPLAVVEAGVRIGRGTVVGAGCYIGANTIIGEDTRVYPNATLYEDCRVGSRVIIHAGAVIGADGFGIALDADRWIKVPQVGRVVLEDDVEVGANTTIDRGAIDDTVIETGVKLDNQIQIGHNVRIGAHTAIAACVGIAGSSRVGRHCRIGGASGIAGHLTIADNVEISAHTLITKSIDRPGTYTGAYPFEMNRDWRRNAAQLRHLNELADRVRALEAKLEQKERSKA